MKGKNLASITIKHIICTAIGFKNLVEERKGKEDERDKATFVKGY